MTYEKLRISNAIFKKSYKNLIKNLGRSYANFW